MNTLGELLSHISTNIKDYIIPYHTRVLNFDDEYIKEQEELVMTDDWGTCRMLIDVFSHGEIPVTIYLYHYTELALYHEFIVICEDPTKGPWYMCNSRADKFSMKYCNIIKSELDYWLSTLKFKSAKQRKYEFKQVFGVKGGTRSKRHVSITRVQFNTKYNPQRVLGYKDLPKDNSVSIGNIDTL